MGVGTKYLGFVALFCVCQSPASIKAFPAICYLLQHGSSPYASKDFRLRQPSIASGCMRRYCLQISSSMVNLNSDGSMQKKIIREGTGTDTPQSGSNVRLHYTMSTGGKLFDSSRSKGAEFEFELGLQPSDAILGWEIAIPTMKKGEIAEVECPPAYAFGENGLPPLVPPNATVTCELELLGWISKSEARLKFAEQYTTSDVPEEAVYEKYKDELQTGQILKDFNLTASGKSKEIFREDDIRLQKLTRRDQRVKGKAKGYRWEETEKTLDLFVALPQGTTTKQINCKIEHQRILVDVQGAGELLKGELHGKVIAGDCVWVLAEEKDTSGEIGPHVHVMLRKQKPFDKIWGTVTKLDKKE